jgi:hypothetical protein
MSKTDDDDGFCVEVFEEDRCVGFVKVAFACGE